MSFYYDETHSITIGEKNTWKDWKLIPNSRPSFQPPLPKNNFTEIPGGNGTLDLSESLTGYVIYEDRVGSWEFILADQETPFQDIYSEIMNYLQGKRLKATLEDDKYFYYEGRFWVNEERSEPAYSLIVIEYRVYPYKREVNSSMEQWLWDPFDFKYGVIRTFVNQEIVSGEDLRIVLPKTEEPVSPIFIVSNSDNLKVWYRVEPISVSHNLHDGTNIVPQITLNKETVLVFQGKGIVSIDYRGGRL